ncbi:endoribonuclease L-PSP [Salinisphaera shabanensis T35B1]
MISSLPLGANAASDAVKHLSPEGAIEPTATWGLASRAGNTLYVAGMRGIDPETNTLVEGDEARVRQAFMNMKHIVESRRRRPGRHLATGGLRHRHVPVPPVGQQGTKRAVGRWPVSAAYDRRGRPTQSGRYSGSRRHFLYRRIKNPDRRAQKKPADRPRDQPVFVC